MSHFLNSLRLDLRSRSGALLTFTLSSFLAVVTSTHAAIYESEHWALSAHAEAAAAYDSNIFARAGGSGDGYIALTPVFALKRLNSLTDLRFEATLESSTFFTQHDLNSIDPSLAITLRYPFDPEVLASQEIKFTAGRHTEANTDFGQRLTREYGGLQWEGSVASTGKTLLIARTGFRRDDYLDAGFNTNDTAGAGLTLAFVSNEKLQLGAGYDYEYDRSRPHDASLGVTSRNQSLYTLRGRGEFLPKVTGNIFLGVTDDSYHGAIARSNWDVAAGASLSWEATARGRLSGTIDRLTYFSADGSAATHTKFGLEWTHELAGGVSAILGADTEKVRFTQIVAYRHDRLYGGHFQLRYALTEQFSAALDLRYISQDSTAAIGNYNREIIEANTTWKF